MEQTKMQPQAKSVNSQQKLEDTRNGFSARASRESVVLLTPWFQTSGLQNHKKINFCCS